MGALGLQGPLWGYRIIVLPCYLPLWGWFSWALGWCRMRIINLLAQQQSLSGWGEVQPGSPHLTPSWGLSLREKNQGVEGALTQELGYLPLLLTAGLQGKSLQTLVLRKEHNSPTCLGTWTRNFYNRCWKFPLDAWSFGIPDFFFKIFFTVWKTSSDGLFFSRAPAR